MTDFDDELRRRLTSAAGSDPELSVAQTRVGERVTQVRRRRAVLMTASSSLVVALLVVMTVVTRQGPNPGQVTPESAAPSIANPTTAATTSPEAPSTTGRTTTSEPTIGASAVPRPGAGPIGGTTTPIEPAENPTSTIAPTIAPTTAPGVSAPATPVTATFSSVGGAIRVRLQDGGLVLVSTDPAAGYASNIERSEPERIEVSFTAGDATSKIEVRLVDGQMVPKVDEDGGGDDTPDDTTGGD